MKTYAAYYDNEIRNESSSGGIFSLLASQFDVIYGVEMDEVKKYAIYARKTDDISSLRGSKYIQAQVGDSFRQVKLDLFDGRRVLFIGTACQVNGLHAFLRRDFSNLMTVDVICHGVPTAYYWQKFIEGKEIHKVNFRAKNGGWENYKYGMLLNDTYIPYNKNKYMTLYVKDYMLRPCCYDCICKQTKKSDITLGDFWGIEHIDSSMSDNKGTSVVIVRSGKGQKLFDKLKTEMVWKEVSYEDGIKQNPSEYMSVKKPVNREVFFEDMKKMSFDELYNKYTRKDSLWRRILLKIYDVKERIALQPNKGNLKKELKIDKVPMLFTRKEECCGCTACKAICPQHAISMVEDEEGFDYPRIEENKCVGCYQCIEVCPIKISIERKKV